MKFRTVVAAFALGCTGGSAAVLPERGVARGQTLTGAWDVMLTLEHPYPLGFSSPATRRVCGTIGFVEGDALNGDGSGRFRAESSNRPQRCDLLPHRSHDAPPSTQCAERHRTLAAQHHPERHVKAAGQQSLRVEQNGNDAHRLLGIIATMRQTEQGRRDELKHAKSPVDRKGS